MKQRYLEIDFMKFAAIIFMIFVHTYEAYALNAFLNSHSYENPLLYGLNYIIEFLGGVPAAPVFMFCMGIGIVFSKKSTPAKLLKRGYSLFMIGLFVNFLEQILPVFWEQPGIEELLEEAPWIFATDVYFFFGLTFFFFALAFALKKPEVVCEIACMLSLIGGLLLPAIEFSSDSLIANLVLGLFVYTGEYSFFPFIPWILFPAAGYLFGKTLLENKERKVLYRKCAIIGATVLILVTIIGLKLGIENSMLNSLDCGEGDYYAQNIISQIWGLGFIGLWLAISFCFTESLKEGKLMNLISWGSKNVMSIYVIQWVVIAAVTPILCMSSNIVFTYISCTLVTISTFILTKAYLTIKSNL